MTLVTVESVMEGVAAGRGIMFEFFRIFHDRHCPKVILAREEQSKVSHKVSVMT